LISRVRDHQTRVTGWVEVRAGRRGTTQGLCGPQDAFLYFLEIALKMLLERVENGVRQATNGEPLAHKGFFTRSSGNSPACANLTKPSSPPQWMPHQSVLGDDSSLIPKTF
jgi:hypothetical protein